MRVPACVTTWEGVNCHRETAHALEVAGAEPELVNITELVEGSRNLAEFAIWALPGGFSDGDHIAAGRSLGTIIRKKLPDQVNDFLDKGGLGVGICNGFQALVESGLLPDGVIDGTDRRNAALTWNEQGGFHCAWKQLRVAESVCKFAQPDLVGDYIELQVAHNEGRLILPSAADYDRLAARGQIVLQYCNDLGEPTTEFPENPNGTPRGIAGITSPDGNLLGVMPHPERSVNDHRPHEPYGRALFESMVDVTRDR